MVTHAHVTSSVATSALCVCFKRACTDFNIDDKHGRPRAGTERVEGVNFELERHEQLKVIECHAADVVAVDAL